MNADFFSGERRLPACFCRQLAGKGSRTRIVRVARASRVLARTSRHRGLFGYVRNLREALAQRKTVSARRRTQHARRVRYPHATQSGSDRLPLRDCGPPVKEHCRNEHARAHAVPRMIRVYSRTLAVVFVRPTSLRKMATARQARPPLHHRALRGRCARIFLGASKVWIKIGTEKSRRWEFRRSHRNSTLDISY